jgi:TRAP-type C4-dicarboxylate transport system substrate-binding protein
MFIVQRFKNFLRRKQVRRKLLTVLISGSLVIVLAALLLVGACPASTPPTTTPATAPSTSTPSQQNVNLVFSSWTPTEMPAPIYWEPFDFVNRIFMDRVTQQTNGRVQFTYYPAETLVKITDMWEATKGGVTDIGAVAPHAFPGLFPGMDVMSLPGLFSDAMLGSTIRQEIYEEGYLAPAWNDVHLLWVGANAPDSIGCRTKQIKTLADLKGLKVCVEGEPGSTFLKAIGAVPVSMQATEFYISLERGTVDAVWQDVNGQVVFKTYEVAPYVTELPGNMDKCIVQVMNKNKYNSLPPDLKAVIDKNSGMIMSMMQGTRFGWNYDLCFNYINQVNAAQGMPAIYTLPDDEWAKWLAAGQPVLDEWEANVAATGLRSKEMYDRAKELADLYKTWGF